jgi:putative ABC transport system permease protein
MRFVAFPIKNLTRRPGRNLFAAVGIALAIATYTAMTVLFGGIADQWKKSLVDAGVHALIVQEMQIDWLASSLPQEALTDVSARPEVRSADGELLSFLTTQDGVAVLASGWRLDSALWSDLDFTGGAPPDPSEPDGAAIGSDLARALGLKIGDRLKLDGLNVEITGAFHSDNALMGGRVVMSLETLQDLMFREGTVTTIHVTLNDPENPEAVAALQRHVAANYPGLSVRPTAQLDQDNRMIDLLNVLRTVVVWIVGIVGLAGTANIMLMAVNERSSEIGLLVAVGWSPMRIIALFLLEAVFLASASGVVGIVAGLAIIEIVRNSATLAAFLSDPVSAAVLLRAFALAVAIGALGGILPAIRALNIPAERALRSL